MGGYICLSRTKRQIIQIQVVSLNTICNLRPDILAYLEASVGSAYGWDGKEWIRETLN